MRTQNVDRSAAPLFSRNAGSSGADSVVTLAAVSEVTHVLDWIGWSYSAAGAGQLSISIGGVVIFQFDVVDAGPGFLNFENCPLYGSGGEAVVITLAGVSGAIGKLNVRYR